MKRERNMGRERGGGGYGKGEGYGDILHLYVVQPVCCFKLG